MKRRLMLLFALSCLIYTFLILPSLRNGFIWDDENFITKNESVRTLQHPLRYFVEPQTLSSITIYNTAIYRPLRTLGFAIQYALFSGNALGFRIVSLFLHLANAFLVLLVLLRFRLGGGMAILFSLLWMFHPLHTEAVSFVSSQGDLLSAFFILICFIICIQRTAWSNRMPLIFVVCLFLSFLSKENALPFLLIYPLAVRFYVEEPDERKKRERIIIFTGFVLAIMYLFLRWYLLRSFTQIDPSPTSWIELPKRVLETYTAYLAKFLWPLDQSSLYEIVPYEGYQSILALAFVATPPLTFWLLQKRRNSVRPSLMKYGLGVAIFVLGLALVSNIVPISIAFAERFLYLPSFGLILILLSWVRFLPRVFWSGLYIVLCGALICLGWMTNKRNQIWSNELRLMQEARHKAQNLQIARRNYIQVLLENQQWSEVVREMDLYEKKWNPDLALLAVRMEATCKNALGSSCIDASVPILQTQEWGIHAARWIILSEYFLKRVDRAEALKRQYCKRSNDLELCTP